jgi:hypothetical protein
LIRELGKLPGVKVERAGSGHWAVRKDGRLITTIASTPSDRRGWANMKAELRRAGIDPTAQKRRVPRRRVTPEDVAAARTSDARATPEAAASAGDPVPPTAAPVGEPSGPETPADPIPYEEETEVSLTVERTRTGWIYTRTRILVRIERWREPLDLTMGDPRKKATSGSTGKVTPQSPPATGRTSAARTPVASPAPMVAEKAPAKESVSAGDKPMAAPPTARAAAAHGSTGDASLQRVSESGISAASPPASTPEKQTTPEDLVAPTTARPRAAAGGERRRRVAPRPRPIPGSIRTSELPTVSTPPRSWIQGGEMPPRSAAEWRKAIPYGSETPVWPTTREPDETDAHILSFIEEEALALLRDVALQVGRQLGYSPEAIYPRVYRLAREGRVALADDSATQRKVVGVIDPEPTDG